MYNKAVRSSFVIKLTINKREISEIIIDDHYKEKHSDINVQTILKLVKLLDGRGFKGSKSGVYEYFRSELELEDRFYRLIWILEDDKMYVGVVNVYRISKRSE